LANAGKGLTLPSLDCANPMAMLFVATFLVNAAFNLALGLLVARFLGPQGFGQYAIAAAIAVVLNTLMLDWIRLAATRFYSTRTRDEDPDVRGTLDAVFILSSIGVALVGLAAVALGFDFGLIAMLAALAPAMAICNGLFDYHTALARARFEERTYSLLVILRNILALALMVGGAWWFQSPVIVAAGLVVSLLATLMIGRRRLLDPDVNLLKPDWAAARRYFLYGFPVIAAAGIYFLIPLWNRTAIASSLGFAQSGQFSLAYDLAIRVVQTIGSALDIYLFQIALKAETEHGADKAKEQLSRNMGVVLAAVAAVATGYWLVLPSVEATLVPSAFQGAFSAVTIVLLPGLACFTLVQAAVTPVFQLRQRTWPVILAALAALAVNGILVWGAGRASIETYAAIQSIGYVAGLLAAVLLAAWVMPVWPRARDVLGAALATSAMIAAVWPIRGLGPGWTTLLASMAFGGVAFMAAAFILNLADCRALLRRRPPA
jgi:O-antigen/teichoic acid export membrane protein